MPEEKPISAYDLCSRVLTASEGDASALIQIAGGQETDWIEFKAACEPPSSGAENGCQTDDYRWHVAKAVVALANTHGGCLLLGVDDDGKAVGLAPSDPFGQIEKEGMDGFLRHLDGAVFRRIAGWKCSKKGTVTFDESLPENLLVYRQASLGGIPVVAVLVRPVAAGESCLYCCEKFEGKQRHFLLIRKAGQLGQIQEITHPKEILSWQKERQPENHHFTGLLKIYDEGQRPPSSPWRRFIGLTLIGLLPLAFGIYKWADPQQAEIKPFATIRVNSLAMEFKGKKESLNQPVLALLAGILCETAPASGIGSTMTDWMNWAKGWMSQERVSSAVKELQRVASVKVLGETKPVGGNPFFSIITNAGEKRQFVPTQLSILIGDLDVRASGDFDSIKGMSKNELQDEFAKRLAEQGCRIPAP